MMKKCLKEITKKNQRNTDSLRKLKSAAVLSAGLALASCGGQTEHINDAGPINDAGQDAETAISLCSEDGAIVLAENRELTLDLGDSVIFPDLRKLTLIGVLDESGAFELIDQDGSIVRSLNMRLEMEYTFGISETDITAAVCSLDGNESRSATIRSNESMELEEAPCLSEIVDNVQSSRLELPAGPVNITNTISSEVDCHGESTLLFIRTEFDPPVRYNGERDTLTDPGRYLVSFLGEEYLLTRMDLESIELAKEAAGGQVDAGGSIPIADGVSVRLLGFSGRGTLGTATVEVVEGSGEVLSTQEIRVGHTADVRVGDSVFGIHIFFGNPDSDWADMGVLSERMRLSNGDRIDMDGAAFSFQIMWDSPAHMRGWVLARES